MKNKNKTCGECQWYDYHHQLCVVGGDVAPTDCACDSYIGIKLTNGDVIRQGGNRDLAEYFVYETGAVFASTLIVDKTFDTYDESVDATMEYLNAPAVSEGEMSKELKPCPFCGSKAELRGGKGVASWIICNNRKCRATQGLELTGENAIKMWNTRPAENALKAEVARLKADLEIQKNLTRQQCFLTEEAFKEADKWKKMFYDLVDKQAKVSTNVISTGIGKGGADE